MNEAKRKTVKQMKEIFRKNHILGILKRFESEKTPLDIFLSDYFRKNKSVGSKDRKFIAETIYRLIRWMGLIDYFIEKPITWEKRIDVLQILDIDKVQKDPNIPSHIKVSFPKKYFDLIEKDYGENKTLKFCFVSNHEAPTAIRANLLRISRDDLFLRFKEKYDVSKCKDSAQGIRFHKKINFYSIGEFREGLFEMQDEGSQLIADLLSPKNNAQVLDYCAGAGGKTLAFAHKMKGKGQIYLHDIRPKALIEAKKRLKRAGVQNIQIIFPHEKEKLKQEQMDWVLLDVPCSGSGTLRRNPDMKWKFEASMLEELIEKQRAILDEALPFLKTGGSIVYATCSIFPDENDRQIEFFLKKYPLKLIKKVFWLPEMNEKDGFFGAVLEKI